MPASNRDLWSQTAAGPVRGSASRTGLLGTRADVKFPAGSIEVPAGETARPTFAPGQLVGRDSGTDGKARQTAGAPINPGTKNWQPLSDMIEKRPGDSRLGPDSSEKIVPENDEHAREDYNVGKSTLGQPEGSAEANWDITRGVMPNQAGRDLKTREGQAVGMTHINSTPSINNSTSGASEGGYDPHVTGSYDKNVKGGNGKGGSVKTDTGGKDKTKVSRFGAMNREDE
jgi:hypothetical protein